jgi:hypothetical protein
MSTLAWLGSQRLLNDFESDGAIMIPNKTHFKLNLLVFSSQKLTNIILDRHSIEILFS